MKKLIFVVCAFAALVSCKQTSPVLTVEGGQIQGVSADIKGVTVYRGIPYAAAPIGDLRWKEPQPVEPWEGVKLCDEFGHPGYQSVHYPGRYTTEWGYGDEAPYSEDCIYLNVWTKNPGEVDKKHPVAFWIHGGGLNRDLSAPTNGRTVTSLATAEQQCKEVLDWVGLTNLQKMRNASTEVLYSLSTIKNMVENPAPAIHGMPAGMGAMFGAGGITGQPVVDGYVSMQGFDQAALEDNLHKVP